MGTESSTEGAIALKREMADVAALLQSSLAPLIRQCEAQRIEIRVAADDGVPRLAVDPEKLAWAVSALVGNAIRYLEPESSDEIGGSVLVHLTAQNEGREVAIAVQDDGPGIPKEKLPSLFVRGPGESHAAGLALLLVRDVAEAHGGRLEVDSASDDEEHYTCVTIVLPRS